MNEAKQARVIAAAQGVFLRYGFRRATMGDLASAAGVSRPALYLMFCNKEQIFLAALATYTSRALAELRAGLPAQPTPREQLRFAFELWAVQPFRMLMDSPDARELIDCRLPFARATLDQSGTAFEAELEAILAPLTPPGAPSPALAARILTRAVHGFKEAATSQEELRGLIDGLLALTLAALQPA